MAKLTGSVDERGRPLVRVNTIGGGDDFSAMVDTGFNGDLMMGMSAALETKVDLNKVVERVELGTGQIEQVRTGTLCIDWLGQRLIVRVLVSFTWPPQRREGPIALIGTRLLRPHLLPIDFDADTLEIETQH